VAELETNLWAGQVKTNKNFVVTLPIQATPAKESAD
jgi:hypothetical protein